MNKLKLGETNSFIEKGKKAMKNEVIKFSWEPVGNIEIKVSGNQNASISYKPSEQVVAETLRKLNKTNGNQDTENTQPFLPPNAKDSQRGDFKPYDEGCEVSIDIQNNNDIFRELSKKSRECLLANDIGGYTDSLKKMASLFDRERSYIDELKVLMIAFYLDLNDPERLPHIDNELGERLRKAFAKSKMYFRELESMYFEVVQRDVSPIARISLKGSYRLFLLCLKGYRERASLIVSNLRRYSNFVDD